MQYQALGHLRHTYANVNSALELINHGAAANSRLPAHGAWQRLVRSLTQTGLASIINLIQTFTRPQGDQETIPTYVHRIITTRSKLHGITPGSISDRLTASLLFGNLHIRYEILGEVITS